MCSFRSCQTRFEFLSQFRKVRNAFECFITQVQTRLPKTKCVWPMKISVICTVGKVQIGSNIAQNTYCLYDVIPGHEQLTKSFKMWSSWSRFELDQINLQASRKDLVIICYNYQGRIDLMWHLITLVFDFSKSNAFHLWEVISEHYCRQFTWTIQEKWN